MLITNDAWLSAGHFFDITVMTPVFRNQRCIGFFGSTIHHTDIGGYGVGAGARDVHEEGLWIPLAKLYEAGGRTRCCTTSSAGTSARPSMSRVISPRRLRRGESARSGSTRCATGMGWKTSRR